MSNINAFMKAQHVYDNALPEEPSKKEKWIDEEIEQWVKGEILPDEEIYQREWFEWCINWKTVEKRIREELAEQYDRGEF